MDSLYKSLTDSDNVKSVDYFGLLDTKKDAVPAPGPVPPSKPVSAPAAPAPTPPSQKPAPPPAPAPKPAADPTPAKPPALKKRSRAEEAVARLETWKAAIAVFVAGLAIYAFAARALYGAVVPARRWGDGLRAICALLFVGALAVPHRCEKIEAMIERQIAGGAKALDKWDRWYVRATSAGSKLIDSGKSRLEDGKKYVRWCHQGRDAAKYAASALGAMAACLEFKYALK